MPAPRSSHYTVLCDRVFDPRSRRFRAQRLEVRDGVFVSVEDLPSRPPPASMGLEVFDLRGMTVLPPLVDPHVHLYLDPRPPSPRGRGPAASKTFALQLGAARKRSVESLLAGVGVLRDLGDPLGINLALVEESAKDCRLARLIAAGPAFHREGRYGRFLGRSFTSLESLCEGIRQVATDPRVWLIKLVPTGIINFDTGRVTAPPQFTLRDLKSAVDLAHDLGKKVAAHASGEEGIRLAVDAAVDFVEHGYLVSRETMERLVEKGIVWTPTFAPVHAQWKRYACYRQDDARRDRLRRILDRHAEMLRFARSIGARLLPGSDAGSPGVPLGGGLWLELELMQEAGTPATELLGMATGQAAEWLGLGDTVGRLACGLAADFIAVEGLVDHDVRRLRALRWVSREGKILPARLSSAEAGARSQHGGIPSEVMP